MLDERAAPRTDRATGPKDAVEKLADRDDADRAIVVAEEPVQRSGLGAALQLYQHGRV